MSLKRLSFPFLFCFGRVPSTLPLLRKEASRPLVYERTNFNRKLHFPSPLGISKAQKVEKARAEPFSEGQMMPRARQRC